VLNKRVFDITHTYTPPLCYCSSRLCVNSVCMYVRVLYVCISSSPFQLLPRPHALSDSTCTPPFFCTHTFASAVHKEMYQSPPATIFSAVAMVWTCVLTILVSSRLVEKNLPGGESPYSMYVELAAPFSADIDPQSISCPIPCPFLKLPLLDAPVPSFDDRIQRCLWQYHTRFDLLSVQSFAAVALTSCNLAHPA
jgi:hypothetical protein